MAKKYYSNNSKKSGTLPSDGMVKQYPPLPCGGIDGYDDTLEGIDRQIKGDISPKGKRSKKDVGIW